MTILSSHQLPEFLSDVRCADRWRLQQAWQKLQKLDDDSRPEKQNAWLTQVEASKAAVKTTNERVPEVQVVAELPIAERSEDIINALQNHQVVVVAGETGSGKTTQLPKLCLQAGFGRRGLIGHTQPRRLAARSVAQRIAEELGTSLGGQVGYQVRFKDSSSDETLIKLMTDGILLAEIQRDRFLSRYEVIIIDEAHERSLNIDFLLGLLCNLLPKRPDLKVIVTSATIDVEKFAAHFNAPVISVEGRTYPVQEIFAPTEDVLAEANLAQQIDYGVATIEDLERNGQGHRLGDVLAFLPGERDIRETALLLRKQYPHAEILPLYARLSGAEQQRIFNTSKRRGRRIVLATNVAETSLTVPGIRYVIDTGLARMSRYSARSKVQRLPIEAISKASANQRKGRCGRIDEGTCIRLYSEQDFNSRPDYTDPEILRTNLSAVILQMASMGLGDIERFPFIDPPDGRFIRDGFKSLQELSAINDKRKLTPLGRSLTGLPVDPRLGRMLLAADEHKSLRELLVLVSVMSMQDPREYPADKKQQAREKHNANAVAGSDFMTLIALWDELEEQRQTLSRNQFSKYCKKNFLSYLRVMEWRDIHRQLVLALKALKLKPNAEQASMEAVHRALCAGLLGNVGRKDERKEFVGARQRRFMVFPGSSVYKKPPNWLLSAELVETEKLYARMNGEIQPDWLLPYAEHLVKRTYTEPHWNRRRGQVMASETISLYGLVISEGKRVNFAQHQPEVARDVFIRQALVESGLQSKVAFWKHNQRVLRELSDLEAKSRRADLMLSDDQLYHFYGSKVPSYVLNQASLERWVKKNPDQANGLRLDLDALLASANLAGDEQFPKNWPVGEVSLPIHYRFEPGHEADGVSVDLPIAMINRVNAFDFDWLVPGMLQDKVTALIKTLPKGTRKQFVPAPDWAAKVLPLVLKDKQQPLNKALAAGLSQLIRKDIHSSEFNLAQLDHYYLMRLRLLDESGKVMATGRNITDLLKQHKGHFSEQLKPIAKQDIQNHTRWEFGDLTAWQDHTQGRIKVRTYPAISDQGETVVVQQLDTPEEAANVTKHGLIRLAMLANAKVVKSLKKDALKSNTAALQLVVFRDRDELMDDLVGAVFYETLFANKAMPRNAGDFEALMRQGRGQLITVANTYQTILKSVLADYLTLHQLLSQLSGATWEYAKSDIQQQAKALFAPGFMRGLPLSRFQHYGRYTAALAHRVKSLSGNYQKDSKATQQITKHCEQLRSASKLQGGDRQLLEAYRWAIEEFRVSLFAQHIGAAMPVSDKRLQQMWQEFIKTCD